MYNNSMHTYTHVHMSHAHVLVNAVTPEYAQHSPALAASGKWVAAPSRAEIERTGRGDADHAEDHAWRSPILSSHLHDCRSVAAHPALATLRPCVGKHAELAGRAVVHLVVRLSRQRVHVHTVRLLLRLAASRR